MNSWQKFFIEQAEQWARKSKDDSTQCGAVVVGPDNELLSTGFNGFPRGVREYEMEKCTACDGSGTFDLRHRPIPCGCCHGAGRVPVEPEINDSERWGRPIKYHYVEHAERNAIYNAARVGVSLRGATMFMNWAPDGICSDCARAIIQAGIARVIGPNRPFPGKGEHWEQSLRVAREMLREAGVELETIDYEN